MFFGLSGKIHVPTLGNSFDDCIYSLFVSTLIILCGCMDFCVTILVIDNNIVQPLKKASSHFKNEGPTIVQLYEEKELGLYDGIQKPEMYLSIIGNVFDVSEAKKFYGPGSTYHIFVGRDNSRAFLTGKFAAEDISDDILPLSPADVIGIRNWLKFYKKTYTKKGKSIGKYYDSFGKLTAYGKQVRKILKQSEQEFASKAVIKQRFPECNVEWTRLKGTKFWCSDQSGGIKRDWEGLPKELFHPGSEPRCACIQESEVHNLENIKSYKNCDRDEKVCFLQSNEKDLQMEVIFDADAKESSIRNEL